MAAQRKGPPRRQTGNGPEINGKRSGEKHTTLDAAALKALRVELGIILQAAHRVAAGYGLAWDDFDRVHVAHQFVIRVLAEMDGREIAA